MSKNGRNTITLQWLAAVFNVGIVVGQLASGGSISSAIFHTLLCCVSVLIGSVVFVVESEESR